jgi:glutathione S-transferase
MANVFIDATPEEVKNAKGLHLLTHATANGMKIHIFLEELKEAYGLGFGYTNMYGPTVPDTRCQKW